MGMTELEFQSYRIAVRIKSIFRSINIPFILKRFEQLGFLPMMQIPTINPLLNDTNLGVKGQILKKGNSIIDVNSDINSIGIQANSIDDLLMDINNFFNVITEMLSDDKKIWFYEFQENIKLKNNGSIASKMKLHGDIIDKVSTFSKGTGMKLDISSIGFWSTSNPDSENFMEIKIQPDILDKKMTVYKVIFRNQKRKVFLDSVENVLSNIELLSEITA